jgi:hypothetical protein
MRLNVEGGRLRGDAVGRAATNETEIAARGRRAAVVLGSIAPWLALLVLEVSAVSIFWLFGALPFMDLPAHAGIAALRLRYSQSAFEQQFYVLTHDIAGYPLFRLSVDGLAKLFGPLNSVRIFASIPAVAMPLALLYGRRRLYNDSSVSFGFAGVILSFGYMGQMGLAPYLIAIPLLLIALVHWLLLLDKADAKQPTVGAETVLAVLALGLVLLHGYTFAVFAFLAIVTALTAGDVKIRLLRLRAFAPSLLFLATSAWVTQSSRLPAGAVVQPTPFNADFIPYWTKSACSSRPR